MKRILLVLVAFAAAMLLCLPASMADEPLPLRDFVEQVLAPMALANDYEWRIVQEFSNEELGALIEACEANGIVLPEDGYLMRHYRSGESYGEESAILDVCDTVFGCDFGVWRLEDRQWLCGVMTGLGYDNWEQETFPGPDDLTEDEARALLFAALHENFGADIPFEDPERFRIHVSYQPDQEWDEDGTRFEDGWSWTLSCMSREGGSHYTAHMDHEGKNASAYETNSGSPRFTATPPEAYALTREEAIHLAAEAIRSETGTDAPLEDPDVYSAGAGQRTATKDGLLYWEVTFPSHSKDWGYCRATVEDVSRVVRVKEADVGLITADNILRRYQNAYGFWRDWPLETWARLSQEADGLPAETLEGRILSGTRYILPREGLLTQLQADEIAFRAAGLTRADIYCMVLIDADPHPVWKFCLWKQYGDYVPDDITSVEIDAVTGEVLHLTQWEYDVDPRYCVYSLDSTWRRLTLAEEGPLPLASMAIKRTYYDADYHVGFLDNAQYWSPLVRGNTVVYEAQDPELADFTVILDDGGFPNLIMVSVDAEEIRYTVVDLGSFQAGDCPTDLSDVVIRPEDIRSFKEWPDIVATGEAILARCQEGRRLTDCSLLSITQYRPEHIWVFEYGKADQDPDTDGGSCFVAIDSKTRSIVTAWAEE